MPKQFGNQQPIAEYLSSKVRAYFEKLGSKYTYYLEFREYHPEIERYGNDRLMEIAERQFHMSSRAILRIIYEHLSTWGYGLAMRFAIQMHVYLSKHLFDTKEEEIIFFKKISETWLVYGRGIEGKVENITSANIDRLMQTFEIAYGNQKDHINSLIASSDDNNTYLIQWQKDCKTIANFYRVNRPVDSFLLYSSLVHMTNNRLGIHVTDEAFLGFTIYKGLEANFNSQKDYPK